MDRLSEAKQVFDKEISALQKTKDALDDTFIQILEEITECKGKVIITGMGKPGHVAKKIAATFASLGTPAFYLHPAEALHGDLGMITKDDIVIAISYSGESDEITRILPNLKLIGTKIIAVSKDPESTLAKHSDIVQILPSFEEACHLNLAPTSSTTVELCYGDALAVVASEVYGFKEEDFGKFHPSGALGKKLLTKVEDLMCAGADNAVISKDATLNEAIVELSKKTLGIVTVIDDDGCVSGVITDGDLRRLLESKVDIYGLNVTDVMTTTPKVVTCGMMAVEVLEYMKKTNLMSMPVVDEHNKIQGTIKVQQIVRAGIL